ncbi:hypothetical protein AB0F20_36195, partial [Streptomyces goshikiensis]
RVGVGVVGASGHNGPRHPTPGPGRAWTDTRALPELPAEPFRDWWARARERPDRAQQDQGEPDRERPDRKQQDRGERDRERRDRGEPDRGGRA